MFFFIIPVIACIFLFCSLYTVSYQVDKESNKKSEKLTFNQFKKLFEAETWHSKFVKSNLVNKMNDSEVFCSTYKINGVKYFFTNFIEYKKWEKYISNRLKDFSLEEFKAGSVNNICRLTCEQIEGRLTNVLKSLCKNLNIKLTYYEELGDAAGKILYQQRNGVFIPETCEIQIINKYKDEPYVLAHELGHYFAVQREDRTEEGANIEALKLIKNTLTHEEYIAMYPTLQIFYKSAYENSEIGKTA